MSEIELTLRIDPETAWELAQFAKRLPFRTCYELTESYLPHEERVDKAYRMIDGMNLVAGALARGGVSPR